MSQIIFKKNSRVFLKRVALTPIIITPPVPIRVEEGYTYVLNTIGFSDGGAANVPGYFWWLYPETEVLQNGDSYPVLFTPDDPSYSSVTIQVPVYYIAPAVISVLPTTPDILFDPDADPAQVIDGPLLNGEATDPYTNEPVTGVWQWAFNPTEDSVFLYAYQPQPVMLPIMFTPDNLALFGNSSTVFTNIPVTINS